MAKIELRKQKEIKDVLGLWMLSRITRSIELYLSSAGDISEDFIHEKGYKPLLKIQDIKKRNCRIVLQVISFEENVYTVAFYKIEVLKPKENRNQPLP